MNKIQTITTLVVVLTGATFAAQAADETKVTTAEAVAPPKS